MLDANEAESDDDKENDTVLADLSQNKLTEIVLCSSSNTSLALNLSVNITNCFLLWVLKDTILNVWLFFLIFC